MPTYIVYVVEDDEDDRHVLETVFADFFDDCTLKFFDNGSQLITALTHCLDGRLPDLILLDLDMPVLNGFDTLQFLKTNPYLNRIPTIVLTTLNAEKNMQRCYELGSDAFMTKGGEYHQWLALVERLHTCWLETARAS